MPAAAEVRFVPPESLLGEKWYVVVVTHLHANKIVSPRNNKVHKFVSKGRKQTEGQ
jgi:hypothetical protein